MNQKANVISEEWLRFPSFPFVPILFISYGLSFCYTISWLSFWFPLSVTNFHHNWQITKDFCSIIDLFSKCARNENDYSYIYMYRYIFFNICGCSKICISVEIFYFCFCYNRIFRRILVNFHNSGLFHGLENGLSFAAVFQAFFPKLLN